MPVGNDTDEMIEVEVENPGTGAPPTFGEWLAGAGTVGGAVMVFVGIFLGKPLLTFLGVVMLILGALCLWALRRAQKSREQRSPDVSSARNLLSESCSNGKSLAVGEQHPTPTVFLDGTIVRFCKTVGQQHQLIARAVFSSDAGGSLVCNAHCFDGAALESVGQVPWPGGEDVLSITGTWTSGYQVQLVGS